MDSVLMEIDSEIRPDVTRFIDEHWYGTKMAIRGEIIDMTQVPGYAVINGGVITGLVTYIISGEVCEIASIDSVSENMGVGTLLLSKVIDKARSEGCRRIQLITTNDNINAIKFYQKRGFDLVGINFGAIDRDRIKKPSIPLIGMHGIPLKHEIEFALEI